MKTLLNLLTKVLTDIGIQPLVIEYIEDSYYITYTDIKVIVGIDLLYAYDCNYAGFIAQCKGFVTC